MKKIFLTLCTIALGTVVASAQNSNLTQSQIDTLSMNAQTVAKDAYVEFPYSKVMFATKSELTAQKFKYNSYYNQMTLQHTNALVAVLGIFTETYIPATNDYRIEIQYGADDMISSIKVIFYDKDIYEHIIMFANDKECNVKEISNGKGKTYTFNYGGYSFTLNYETVTQEISNTSSTTTTSNSKDQSKSRSNTYSNTNTHEIKYDQYVYTVNTGCEPVSEYLAKQAARKAKRAVKGKKSNSSASFL